MVGHNLRAWETAKSALHVALAVCPANVGSLHIYRAFIFEDSFAFHAQQQSVAG